MKVICITQARMGSSRLPGKVLLPINGIPLLSYHIERVKTSTLIDKHIIATSNLSIEQPLVDYCIEQQQAYFCGDEQNVLHRFYHCALQENAQADDLIVRLTGDCPLICGSLIDQVIRAQMAGDNLQYSHLSLAYFPRGFDVEVFSMRALTDAYRHAIQKTQQEHVTLYIYNNPQLYTVVPVTTGDKQWANFRLCVDEVEDYNLINQLVAKLGTQWPTASPDDICNILLDDKELAQINANVMQRTAH